MKQRNGFVSNSSSSSFVIMGFTVPRDRFDRNHYLQHIYGVDPSALEYPEDEFYDRAYNESVVVRDHEENGAPKDKTLIGIVVADWGSDEWLDANEFEVEDLWRQAAEARTKLNLVDEEAPIRLYVGTRAS